MTLTKTQERSPRKEQLVPITDRAFAFAVRVVKLCTYLEKHSDVGRNTINQLLNAATSVGANHLEEAVAGQSKADFIHKNAIALKEARETNYRLPLISATNTFKTPVKEGILELELELESGELSRIIGKRIVSSKKK
ncbi:MAG TPA: four helix bundle protein [Pyrinomonadaceae bacterium]